MIPSSIPHIPSTPSISNQSRSTPPRFRPRLWTLLIAFLFWQARPLHCLAHFTPSYSQAIQCGSFTATWNDTSIDANSHNNSNDQDHTITTGPPYILIIVPVNPPGASSPDNIAGAKQILDPPLQITIPESAWNQTTRQGRFTLEELPIRAGTSYIVTMDDGINHGTGGVTDIRTVMDANGGSTNSCLPAVDAGSTVEFTPNTYQPAQCSVLSILSNPPSSIRGFVPLGTPFSIDTRSAPQSGNVTTQWMVNVPTGTSFVLFYEGLDGSLASTGLIKTVAAPNGDDSCLINSPVTTLGQTGSVTSMIPTFTFAAAAASSSAPGHSKLNVGILVGAIIGTLAVLASIALTTFFCLLRRTDRMGKIKTFPSYSSRGRDKTIQTYEFQSANASGGSDRERERERRERVEPYARLDDAKKNDKHDKHDRPGSGHHGGKKDHPSGPPRTSSGTKSPAQALEGRLGDIFGSRKVGKSSGGSGGGYGGYGRSSDRKFTSSAKRAMYPGLSIASTQNRTMGDTTDYGDESDYGRDGNGNVGSEEGPVRAGSRVGSDPFTVGGRVEEGRDPNPWRDEKRQDHVDLSRRSGSPPNAHPTNATYITNSNANSSPNANANSRGYGYTTGLGAIPESSGSGYGNDAGSQISNTHSLHSNSQSVVSGTIPLLGKSPAESKLGHHTSQSAGASSMASMGIGAMPITSRPSTATGATGYHLPTGLNKPIHQSRPSDPVHVGVSITNGVTNGFRMDNTNPNPHPSTRPRGENDDDSLGELVDANITDDEGEAPRVRDDVMRLGDGARRDMRSERSTGSDRAPGTIAETKTIETTATNRTGHTDRTNQTHQSNHSRPSNHTRPTHGTNGSNGTQHTEGSEFEPPWAKAMHPYARAQSPHLPTRELDNVGSMEARLSQHNPNQQNQYGQPGTSQGLDLANLGITLSHPYSNPLVTATAATSTSYPPPSSYNQTSPTTAARSTSRERNENSFDEPRLHPYGAMYTRSIDDDEVASNSTHAHPQSHVHSQPMAMGLGFEHPPFYDDPARNGSGNLSSQRGGSARLKRPPR